jgi:conjugative transposon TraN protein
MTTLKAISMEKNMIAMLYLILSSLPLWAQRDGQSLRKDLPTVAVQAGNTVHFHSPEPIRYVDISSGLVAGDLAAENVLRIKYIPDSGTVPSPDLGVITIIGESYIAQYNLLPTDGHSWRPPVAQVEIRPDDIRALEFPEVTMTRKDMEAHALHILRTNKAATVRSTRGNGINLALNGIYTIGHYIFLDITLSNRTKLPYDIDALRFTVDDRKINKATNAQSVEVDPVWQLYPHGTFRKTHRNIYALRKLTFPGNKVLRLNLSEKQLSGRNVELRIRYGDLLSADSL